MNNLVVDSNIFCIFIFILIISANFLAEIFPCRLQDALRNNMYLKHLFGLFTMIFFVVFSSSGTPDKNIFHTIGLSLLLYILFILITKCQIYVFFIILLFLGTTYIINIVKQQEIENSNKSSSGEASNKQNTTIYDTILYVLYILIFVFTFIGVIMYMGEKKIEYNKDFNYITFFIGKSICKGKSPKVNMIEAFKNAFY
jgi:hypothetical protein